MVEEKHLYFFGGINGRDLGHPDIDPDVEPCNIVGCSLESAADMIVAAFIESIKHFAKNEKDFTDFDSEEEWEEWFTEQWLPFCKEEIKMNICKVDIQLKKIVKEGVYYEGNFYQPSSC